MYSFFVSVICIKINSLELLVKFLQNYTQSSSKTTKENDVDKNICVYIIFLGDFAADFQYAFAEISLTTPRKLFFRPTKFSALRENFVTFVQQSFIW